MLKTKAMRIFNSRPGYSWGGHAFRRCKNRKSAGAPVSLAPLIIPACSSPTVWLVHESISTHSFLFTEQLFPHSMIN